MDRYLDERSYRRTRKKKYIITASMPPEGTVVVNHLEMVRYITSRDKQIVLTGTAGEQWVISANKLCNTYRFPNGKDIDTVSLISMIVDGYRENGEVERCIKPFRVLTKPGINCWADFVPVEYTFKVRTAWGDELTVNDPRIGHGKGDFIVCSEINGKPNLEDRWVVNGLIFADTYDIRGFSDIGIVRAGKQLKANNKHPEFKGISWKCGK